MKERKISLEEWQKLYDQAVWFRDLKSWQWLADSDIFGIKDPVTGVVGYCSLLGRNQEVFALVVYMGSEGLAAIPQLYEDPSEMIYLQNCLFISFGERRNLHQQDLQLIKDLELKFRGKNNWPMFRRYLPGYTPWFFTADEVRFATCLLEQASLLVMRLKENLDLLQKQQEHFLVRVPKIQNQQFVWFDQYLKPEPIEAPTISNYGLDELRLYRLRNRICKSGATWEMDIFFSPSPIQENLKQRPYFPRVSLWLDRTSGLIVSYHLSDAIHYPEEFREQFLNLLEENKIAPREILVKSQEAYFLLQPITNYLNIKLKRVPALKMLEEAKTGLYEYFMI